MGSVQFILFQVEKREEKLEKLRQKEPEKAVELDTDIKWQRAVSKAQGVKVKVDFRGCDILCVKAFSSLERVRECHDSR